MEHLCPISPINSHFTKIVRFYTTSQTYHHSFLRHISLTTNLSGETFGSIYIAVMISKSIA